MVLTSNKSKSFSVDVILPSYNKFNFLEEAINSVLNQTFKNWHMYIIDDHSTDNSWSIVKKYSELDNVTCIRLNRNMGPSFCRNYAMRISKSKYISFIDADDIWQSAKLERQIVEARVPEIKASLQKQLVAFVQGIRELDLKKQPAISETIDWAKTLILLNSEELDAQLATDTLNVLLKHQQDIDLVAKEVPRLISDSMGSPSGKSIN